MPPKIGKVLKAVEKSEIFKDLGEDIPSFIQDTRQMHENLKDYPLWIRSIGYGWTNASKGIRLFRKIKSLADELDDTPSKFKESLGNMTTGALYFIPSIYNLIPDNFKQDVAREGGRLLTERLQNEHLKVALKRSMEPNKVSMTDLRKMNDIRLRRMRGELTGSLLDAFDAHNELVESQLIDAKFKLDSTTSDPQFLSEIQQELGI